jgi:hypothetical protein
MSWDLAKHAAPLPVITWAFLVLGLALFALAGFGWSRHLSDDGIAVANNVRFAGELIEGWTPDQVAELVSARATDLLTHPVTIEYGQGQLTVAMEDIGFSYDEPATVELIMASRHEGSVWEQFSSWAISELVPADVVEIWEFDGSQGKAALDDHPDLTPVVVKEPEIVAGGRDGLEVIPGIIGVEADIEDIVRQLFEVDLIGPPDRVVTTPEAIHPTVSDDKAQEAADHLNALTGEGARMSVSWRSATLTRRALQGLLDIEIGDGAIATQIDGTAMQATLENMFVGPVGSVIEPVIEVDDETIAVVARGEPPPVCCRRDVGEWVAGRILAGSTGPFGLATRPAEDPGIVAWADGSAVVEKVSEFTTPHACCEARVQNIQRMADILRGVYLVPGETLSLNEFVGPRTRENGFVAAGAIRQGHLILEVGGGVSQFATTIFNAAYFAGMDFDEYRSHTIYFSRYPYGREATISNPAPDLVMTNTTDYPILIWTSYTDQSITVSMYSTKHIEITELDQRSSRRGACTHVETDRQRSYHDGRVVVDTFVADYRPAEGIDCNGNPIPPPV